MLDMKKYGIAPFGAVPSERQLAHYEMKKAFFHFGVNTFTDAEWGNGSELEKAFDLLDTSYDTDLGGLLSNILYQGMPREAERVLASDATCTIHAAER